MTGAAPGRVRVDVWLDVACVFRTRSEAQRACRAGRIVVNGLTAKPHREIRPGDRLVISRPGGGRQELVVKGLAERHVPKADARHLYDDVTPPPTPEERELQELLRLSRPIGPRAAPDTRTRRMARRLKGHIRGG